MSLRRREEFKAEKRHLTSLVGRVSPSVWRVLRAELYPSLFSPDRRVAARSVQALLEHGLKPAEMQGVLRATRREIIRKTGNNFFVWTKLQRLWKHNPSVQDLESIGKVLEQVPKQSRSNVAVRVFDWFENSAEAREKCRVLVEEVFPHIHESNRNRFFEEHFPKLLDYSDSPRFLRVVGRLLHDVKNIQWQDRIFMPRYNFMKMLGKRASLDEVERQHEIARSYLEKGGLFFTKIVAENFGRLPEHDSMHLPLLEFQKMGERYNKLYPLGGRFIGKIRRVMKRKAFEQWQKAHDAGIPVEPILKTVGGRPMAYGVKNSALVRVYTKYCGENAEEFVEKHPELRQEIERQQNEIRDRVRELGINYGYAKARADNFTVELIDADGIKKLLVRLIDWDEARPKRN